MKKTFLIGLIICLIFIVGCNNQTKEVITKSDLKPELKETKNTSVPNKTIETKSVEQKKVPCTHNSNCTSGNYCIEGRCKQLTAFYNSSCQQKCKVKKIEISTSDKETLTLSPGEGSYTAAGALNWKIISIPQYCKGKDLVIPIKILKRNYGKVFSDEVVMLKKGETSKTITHPIMDEIAFKLTIKEIKEECS
jgi:hypothetical protein